MAKGKKSSPSAKAYYSAYKAQGLHEKHKLAKLERHVNKNPEDTKAKAALDRILKSGAKYIRNNKSESGIRNHASYTYKEKQLKKGGTVVIANLRMESKFRRSLNSKFKAAMNEEHYRNKKNKEPRFTCLGDALRHVKADL